MESADIGRRVLRNKEKKSYQDSLEDEIEGKRRFDIQEILESDKYRFEGDENLIRNMEGKDFNLQFIQEHGFNRPLKFSSKEGLGLRMPSAENFDVNDIKSFVGARRMVDVVDANTQQSLEMTMLQWTRYFTNPNRKKILNVISLEFSHTGMDHMVEPPEMVRMIDWVNIMWPPELIEQQTDTTNNLDDMKYPKVKKYVLMSVGGCYTDFHIDFGGTSVWYHIIKGEKIFWVIEPNDNNLLKYEKWTLSTKQEDVFFGDVVDKCCLVHLKAGDTFMIPSGWIHAVYTPRDSLVFGGNFIHSYSISMQIRVSEIEHKTKVPNRFRFPFYPQIHWYAAKRYTELLEKDLDEKEKAEIKTENGNTDEEFIENKENFGGVKNDVKKNATRVKKEKGGCENGAVSSKSSVKEEESTNDEENREIAVATPHWKPINMLKSEVKGLIELIERLRTWDRAVNNCPEEITDQEALLDRLEELVEMHENDDQWLATRGVDIFDQYDKYLEATGCATPTIKRRQKAKLIGAGVKDAANKIRKPKSKSTSSASRKRRLRCGTCDGCTRGNCGNCKYCLDMPKFGGPGKMKQSCIYRICLNPTLPTSARCSICNETNSDDDNPLMECSICAGLTHPNCCDKKGPCKISETLNNCWECPNCCTDEEAGDFDANLVRGKMDPLKRKLAASVGCTDMEESSQAKKRSRSSAVDKKSENKRMSQTCTASDDVSESESDSALDQEMEQDTLNEKESKKVSLPKEKPVNIVLKSVEPTYIVRPKPITPPKEELILTDGSNHPLKKDQWLQIFRFLTQSELCLCMRVCRTWNRWAMSHNFWMQIDASDKKITSVVLEGIVRRQPLMLSMGNCNITFSQMKWLLARLPRLIRLDLRGNTSSIVTALLSGICPPLRFLDISWCEGVRDDLISDLLSPVRDSMFPKRTRSRLSKLEDLSLAGCDITDKTVQNISRFLPSLERLDVSFCTKLTDSGVDVLTSEASICRDILREVNLSGCSKLTNSSLQFLMQCAKEPRVVIERCDQLMPK